MSYLFFYLYSSLTNNTSKYRKANICKETLLEGFIVNSSLG